MDEVIIYPNFEIYQQDVKNEWYFDDYTLHRSEGSDFRKYSHTFAFKLSNIQSIEEVL